MFMEDDMDMLASLVQSHRMNELINEMAMVGLCPRCALRYVGGPYVDFVHPLGVGYPGTLTTEQPCVVCLDMLADHQMHVVASNPDLGSSLAKYDNETVMISLRIPLCVILREHAMILHLENKFPDVFGVNHDRPRVSINKAYFLTIRDRLPWKLGKVYDDNSGLQIRINTSYAFTDQELETIISLNSKLSADPTLVSRATVLDALEEITNQCFRENFAVPPLAPPEGVILGEVTCRHEAIYIGGRYFKAVPPPQMRARVFMNQTKIEMDVLKGIGATFKSDRLQFCKIGKEDFDMGIDLRGRLFYVKISNPKRIDVPESELRDIAAAIRRMGFWNVSRLQKITLSIASGMKKSDSLASREYQLICMVGNGLLMDSYIDKINAFQGLNVVQKPSREELPVRTSRRRGNAAKRNRCKLRTISKMKAERIPSSSNLLQLNISVDSGIYVKEFITGEQRRSKPTLAGILADDVQLVSLVSLDIDDFLPSVGSSQAMIQ